MLGRDGMRSTWLALRLAPALLLLACMPAVPNLGGQGARTGPAAASDCGPLPLDAKSFPQLPRVDNRFLPLLPGMQLFLDGFVVTIDGARHPHRIDTTVTKLTKVIAGVNTVVVFERDIQDGRLAESELFFAAQDDQGRVWTFGEYPEEYDNGQLLGAPSTWLEGVAGARAGIAMLAQPRVGSSTYLQGLGPKVGFKDCATVFQTGQRACTPVTCYEDVLVTDEFAPLKPKDGHQRKLYAPAVGNIKVTAAGGVDPEALELTRAAKLCPAELQELQAQALSQDARGYQVARDVYAGTAPAKEELAAQPC